MFNRRNLLQSGFFLALTALGRGADASASNELKLNKKNLLESGEKYFFPVTGVTLGSTCTIERKAFLKKPPVILAKNTLLMTQTEDLVVDKVGVFRAQYLGPDLGWHII